MFVAFWMVCVIGWDCREVVENDPVLHESHAECMQHAQQGAMDIIKLLYEERKRAEIGWGCRKFEGV